MVSGNTARVRFDFDGSLTLARKLWALADLIESAKASRAGHAAIARDSWRGKYAEDFALRVTDESTSFTRVIHGLREEACGWATCWKKAMDEQNRRNRARQVDATRAKRSWVERNIGDLFLGDDSDSQVPMPPSVAVPQPPHFLPTQEEVTY